MKPSARAQPSAPHLFGIWMLISAWAPAALITTLHYLSVSQLPAVHFVLRRLYYFPILFGAFRGGLRGGLLLAVSITVAYSPHAFGHVGHGDPANDLEKVLEMLLYLVVGCVAGFLVDRDRDHQLEVVRSAADLRVALDEQRRTAAALVRAGRLAALGELVAGIAHEIKNPLHALRGTAEIVDDAVDPEAPQRKIWELHKKEIDRLEEVAEQFLSFARPKAPARKPERLREIVERVRQLVEAQASKHGIDVAIVDADDLDVIDVDEQQITQVLLNIALNAIQAIGDSAGTIRFSLRQEPRGRQHYQIVEIENSGPPIDDDRLERIFDPFTTTKSDGSGLGLSIAARIVEQHGGLIETTNTRDGVLFTVALPCARGATK